jgi:hypothetical protein
LFIHGTIPVTIFAADLDRGFVQAPTLADRTDASFALPFAKGLLQHRNQLDDPAVNGGMIDEQAALLHDLFEIAQTQRVGDVPPDAQHCARSLVCVSASERPAKYSVSRDPYSKTVIGPIAALSAFDKVLLPAAGGPVKYTT